ncbi:hypothetical protein D3C76_741530 [compost metagenome]
MTPLNGLSLLLVLVAGGWMVWKDAMFRREWQAPEVTVPQPPSHQLSAPLKVRTTELAFGLLSSGQVPQSTEQLLLKAIFIAPQGDSRVLIGAQGRDEVYRIGDSVPGGSVLRQIGAQQIVLWRAGREERLPLVPADRHFLATVAALTQASGVPASRYFLPDPQVQP